MAGAIDEPHGGADQGWFAWASAGPQLRRWSRDAIALLYAAYAWVLLVMIAVPTWLAVAALLRWTVMVAPSSLRRLEASWVSRGTALPPLL